MPTSLVLSLVNGSPLQPLHRERGRISKSSIATSMS
jgi:hypothetical protein